MGWRQASWTWGDPGYWNTESVTRKRGLVCAWKVNFKTINGYTAFGLSIAKSSNIVGSYIRFVLNYIGASSIGNIETAVANTDFYFAIVLRDSGASYFVKKSTNTWKYCGQDTIGNAATYYPGIAGYSLVGYCDWIRQSNYLWMPKPLISDNFAGTDGAADGRVSNGLGHAETTGLGSGGAGVALTVVSGTAEISSNKLIFSAVDGTTGVGLAVWDCTNANHTVEIEVTRTGGEAGIVVRYTDINNYVYAEHTGTHARLIKVDAGTPITVTNVEAAYSAGAKLTVRADGATVPIWYNNALIGSITAAVSEAGLQTGTKIGVRTTDTGNTFDNLTVYPVGTGGEYEILTRLIGS